MKITVNNLTAVVLGFNTTMQQQADAALEFQKLVKYVDELEDEGKANEPETSTTPIINYEYEHLFRSDENEPCPIDGWYPIAAERIKNPEKIPEYIKKGFLRKYKPKSETPVICDSCKNLKCECEEDETYLY